MNAGMTLPTRKPSPLHGSPLPAINVDTKQSATRGSEADTRFFTRERIPEAKQWLEGAQQAQKA